ncbi:MAG TPA: hypothetical protein VMU50_04170 [Polyangia bacterium]|nr:hypothetical protein [Polyangia bacterium]
MPRPLVLAHDQTTAVAGSAAPAAPLAAEPAPFAKPAALEPAATPGPQLGAGTFGGARNFLLPSLFELAPPPAAAPFLAQAADDPTLQGTIMTDGAHVSLDAGAAGEITLHLRVKDGVADVRVEGAAVPALEIRQQELRVALASEGLSLGGFESGQSPARDDMPRFAPGAEPDHQPPPRPTPEPVTTGRAVATPGRTTATTAGTTGGRLHVTA